MKYAPLYIKTENSLLSSLIKIDDLILKAKELGYEALTITDKHMFGVMEFYFACVKNGIKPIIGLEVTYLGKTFVLYAKNYEGYQSLTHLETILSKDEVTHDDLSSYRKNVILILPYESICLKEELEGIYDTIFYSYKNESEYTSLQQLPKVFMNQILSFTLEDTVYLKYLEAIDKGCLVTDVKTDYQSFYLRSKEEYQKLDHDLFNNQKIMDMVDIQIPKRDGLLAIYDTGGVDENKYLRNLCKEGLKKRFGQMVPKVYLERIKYELDVIEKMGFSNYFLVVSDYVNYAKENGILVGPGRGSAAGSLVSYVLNITNIDPIRYQLLFERFLNPERVTMPDIDVDFLDSRRQEVIDYCVRKYGLKRTSGIITFGTLSSKQVVRDVFRTLNMDVSLLSKMLDAHLTLEENRKSNVKLNEYLTQNKDVLKAYTVALKLEGLKRHTSLHAAGVVISSVDLDEVVPLYYHDGMYLTCYSMNYLEDLGLLKMDFLGLKNLNIIDRILKDLKKDGICVDLDRIPFNDPMTLNIFTTVNTTGIFQFESEGMMNFLKKLKPNCFEDIYAALALYRPGPMGNIDTYIRRKKGEESYTCYPNLEEVLKPTYGILIYQEQIMQVANIMASYTFGEADILRRAMSKKKEDVLLKERDHFISNSIANGYSKEMAEEVYQFILKFASYGFNKAHSVAYGMISYQMAYLKAHYPAYFIRGLLDMAIGSSMATKNYLYEARMNHIRVLPPDINLSFDTYSLEDGSIRYPLYNIKGVGGAICSAILEERKNGKFLDIYDFIARTYSKTINKQVLMSLIMAGVFDSFGFSRHTLIFNMDAILNYAEVISYLDREYALKPVLEIQEEYPKRVLMEQEREVFGFYLTNHPITELRDKLKNNIRISALKNYFDQNVSFLASVKSKREIKTKKGDTMCFLSLEDEEGMISGVLFASTYQNSNPTVGKIYLIQAHIEKRFDEYQAVIRQINEMEI